MNSKRKEFKENKEYYNEFSKRYEKRRTSGYHALVDDLEADFVLKYGHGKKILEVGCGTGLILSRIKERAIFSIGVDLSEGMLEKAKKRNLKVVQGSILGLPFEDNSFDIVYSFKVLPHIPEINKAVSEMCRVAKKDGYIIAEFYNHNSLRALKKKIKWASKISDDSTDKDIYTRYDKIIDLQRIAPQGYRIIDSRGIIIFTPVAWLHCLPFIGKFLAKVEKEACDTTLRKFAGFYTIAYYKT